MRDTPAVASFAIPESAATSDTVAGERVTHVLAEVWRDGRGRAALLVLAALAIAAIVGPWLSPFDPIAQPNIVALKSQAPSLVHWFGTDMYSRDVLARLLVGARISLAIAVLSAAMSSVIGTFYGGIAGYVGGRTDSVLMRLVDVGLAVPRVLLLIAVLALWGRVSAVALILLLGGTGWFGVSRIARGASMATRARDYVSAACALGAGHVRVFVRHVLPNTLAPVLVAATIAVGNVIVLEAGLSYLGYGVQQPQPSWGNIIMDGRETIGTTWWLTLFPGLALIVTALALNTLADRLRAALNPRQLPAP